MIFGVLSMAVSGIIIDKTKAYLTTIRIISIVGTLSLLNALWVIPYGNFYITLGLCSILGGMMCPILPASFSFTVFLTHPVPPAVSNGILMCGANLYAVIFCIVGGKLLLISFFLGASLFCVFALTTVVTTLCIR